MNPKINTSNLLSSVSILFIVMLSSCASRKEMVYFQDEPLTPTEFNNMNTELVYQPNDLLTIDINGADPETVQPFKLPPVTFEENMSVINAQGTLRVQAYLIDVNGNIEFPILGTLKIAGMTRTQTIAFFKEKLSEYVKDPIVNVRLANFTISVLGEVNRPGVYTIQDERISLSEALGLAGDLTNTGKRDNIFLIREVDGKKKFAKLDLTSINIVNSPLYYLVQNDVIYVEPNTAKIRSSTYNPNTALVISAISTLATIAAILIR
ncbi:polysaccharide biosynthesis/export family protein [Subsaxibacter sp. CAU 1640]|uniref:polysaccharide biosynthesis/export family protein n=1 Tax=Subsaxibacter sp. CAU 1640 TaxID=2933271 RepID=UPI0020047D77|nr:polysaccharide biosynthesis/export family protein [Subsaxibacter sp. CAU 1640]MCK7591043.1 polysaccharide biosynthesis/export family protein [Subsaxibacter sp. CAU 1640]